MLFYLAQVANGGCNMLADINKPTLTKKIKDLVQASDLCGILKSYGIERYAYSVRHYNSITQTYDIMKIGMSADNASNYGDRIYRQVNNLPGWPTMPRSGCGKDIITVVHDYQRDTGLIVHKDDCVVEIWDVTHAPQRGQRIQRAAEDAETELLDQYVSTYGKLPIGNPKDTRKSLGKPFVGNDTFNDLFKFELAE